MQAVHTARIHRQQLSRRWLLLAVAACTLPVAATTLTTSDTRDIRAAVQGQLDAFAADDAARAFAFAAPNVRQRMGTAERFLAMVRSGYPVVYRPASVAFLIPDNLADGTVVQRVQMTDARGDAWLATYTLQRQPDKAWRITGCEVQPNKGRVA